MHSNEKIINKLFFYWLVTSLLLVYFIIIIGGLTRLTDSGLSITEWELIKGILPPLSSTSWEIYFEQYKQIPQYKLLNFNMSLDEFKIIFFWEYFHRVLARFIGIFFLIPLIYFYFTKKIKDEYLKICYLIFALIVGQGIVGWYMVKSGLVNDVTVSHYRLSIHLSIAILIISIIFWLIKNINHQKNIAFFKISSSNFPFQFFILIIYLQIIMGAFVSGLDAGLIYQTWPKMNLSYFPDDLVLSNYDLVSLFSDRSFIQFLHRNVAYFIVLFVIAIGIKMYIEKKFIYFKNYLLVFSVLIIQVLLGIYTLVSGLNLYLASLHQITSVILVFTVLKLNHNLS